MEDIGCQQDPQLNLSGIYPVRTIQQFPAPAACPTTINESNIPPPVLLKLAQKAERPMFGGFSR
jgi:hypothetical protein